MSNMSYCRFRNTLSDLQDCYDNINDDLSDDEFQARRQLIIIARKIADRDENDFVKSCDNCGCIACDCYEEAL